MTPTTYVAPSQYYQLRGLGKADAVRIPFPSSFQKRLTNGRLGAVHDLPPLPAAAGRLGPPTHIVHRHPPRAYPIRALAAGAIRGARHPGHIPQVRR